MLREFSVSSLHLRAGRTLVAGAIALSSILCGCGIKGPLKLPPGATPVAATAPGAAATTPAPVEAAAAPAIQP